MSPTLKNHTCQKKKKTESNNNKNCSKINLFLVKIFGKRKSNAQRTLCARQNIENLLERENKNLKLFFENFKY